MTTDSILATRSAVLPKLAALGNAVAYLLLALIRALLDTALAKGLFGVSLLGLARGDAMAGTVRAE